MPESLPRLAVLLAIGLLVTGCASRTGVVTLRYGLELDDRDGTRFVQEDFAFRSGDRFRFVIESQSSVYAYLFNRGTDEPSYTQLFPREPGRPRELPADSEVTVPPDTWYRMDREAGTEQVVLVVATEPVDQLDLVDEEDLRAEEFERRLGEVERTYRPERFRRRVVDDRVELVAEGPSEGIMVIVVRMPLRHDDIP